MKKLKIAAIGTEHRHIFGQLKGMLDLGCECVGWWNDGDNKICLLYTSDAADA